MKILVFDDNENNRKVAKAQLKGHDLTVVETYDEAKRLVTAPIDGPSFDAVLVDLLVPASRYAQGYDENRLVGTEMPLGIFIGLLAAVKGRARYVAVFTDTDHHSHPASACLDAFNKSESRPTPFIVEGSKVLLSNRRGWVSYFDKNDLSVELDYQRMGSREAEQKGVRAKNWAALLAYLLSDDKNNG